MRRALPVSLCLSLIAATSPTRADTLASELDYLKLSEALMAQVAAGDLDGAFKAMKPYLVIPDAEFDAMVAKTKAQRGAAGSRYGKTVGWECIRQKKVGLSLARVTCWEKTEKHALPWLFYFYKSPRGWVLNSFTWNDNLPSLFAP